MIRNMFRTRVVFATLLILLASISAIAQNERASSNAYLAWKQKQTLLNHKNFETEHVAVGFAARKYMDIGVTVDITIGVGSSISTLPPLEFVVQPIAIRKDAKGQDLTEKLGARSIIKSPRLDGFSSSSSGIAARPELTTRMPAGANAVHVTVLGFGSLDQTFSIVLPVKDQVSTAVLAKMGACSSGDRSMCQWFTGSCGDAGEGCPQGTLCVACNNGSPSLNCTSCTMGCGGGTGSNCSPDVEAPAGCSIS